VQLSAGAPMTASSNAEAMETAVRGLRGSEA
jgi:hypothetical protein